MIECSSYQIDLAPTLDPRVGILINVSEDHLDRHGTHGHYAAVKERLVAGVQAGGTAVIGVDDDWCAAAADAVERAGQERRPDLGARRRLHDGIYAEDGMIVRAMAARRQLVADLAGIGSLRGLHNAQNAACAAAAALALGLDAARHPAGPALVSRPGAPHGAGRAQGPRCCSSTIPRRPTPIRRRRRWPRFNDMFWIAGGKPKTGGITSLRRIFPAHPQGLSDRRGGAETSPRTLDGKVRL